jgi:hypothetical protein
MSTLDLRAEIRAELARLAAVLPENRPPALDGPLFTTPLVGFAAADDPLFIRYREVVGPFHRTPGEWLAVAATVICWILPIAAATRACNRAQTDEPSREWAVTRTFGEACNNRLREEPAAWLLARGHAALAPVLQP